MRHLPRPVRPFRLLFPFLIAAAMTTPALGANRESTDSLSDAKILKRFRLPSAALSYLVIDAQSGKVLEQSRADRGYVPASAIKIATTVAALEILGAEHHFETQLYMTGRIEGGTLRGDLYLVGRGDPVLTTEDFQGFIDTLKRLGVTRVTGRFYFDDSYFLSSKAVEQDHDHTVAYNPGVGPLSLNFNRLRLIWQKDRKNGGLDARIYATTDKTRVEIDYLKTGYAEPNHDARNGLVYREQGDDRRWLLIRHARPKGEIWLPVKYPGYMTAHVFRKFAADRGLALPDPVRGTQPAEAQPLYTHRSIDLYRIVAKVNWFSNNMAAEMLGLGAARRLSRRALGVGDANLVLSNWWKGKIPGVDWTGFDVHNHSGLSTESRVSARQLVAVLRYADGRQYARRAYERLLKPFYLGGRRGALPRHVYARAKTGTINYSRAVAGYLTTASKRRLIFAVFVSDYAVREAMQAAGKTYKLPRRRGWMGRSYGLMRAVVRRWALSY